MARKDESQETTNALIAQRIEQLHASVTEGFRVTHEKQNYTNGKVTKAGEDIIELQKADIALDNKFKYNKVIWYSLTVSISMIIALSSYIILK